MGLQMQLVNQNINKEQQLLQEQQHQQRKRQHQREQKQTSLIKRYKTQFDPL